MGFRIDRNRYAVVGRTEADALRPGEKAKREHQHAQQDQSTPNDTQDQQTPDQPPQGAALESLKKEVQKVIEKFVQDKAKDQSHSLAFSMLQEGADLLVQVHDPAGKLVRKIRALDFLRMQSSSARIIDQKAE